MASHTLIYQRCTAAPTSVLGWSQFNLYSNPRFFRPAFENQQVGELAPRATSAAIASGGDVTVGWGDVDLWRRRPMRRSRPGARFVRR